MKKVSVILLCMLLAASAFGCAEKNTVKETIEGNLKTYYRMADGTWMWEDQTYQYRLEISGRMRMAAMDSTFVFLSNMEEISFEQAWKQIFSSNSNDFFSPEEAVLVEIRLE